MKQLYKVSEMHIRKSILFNMLKYSKWGYLLAGDGQLKYLFKAKQEEIGMLQHDVSVAMELFIIGKIWI